MSNRPVYVLRVHVGKLALFYQHNPSGTYGTRLMIGSRNWLKPGEYLWSFTFKGYVPPRYRKWRSVWRRPIARLGVSPVYSAWHKRSRKK